jgi:hypothetical protein
MCERRGAHATYIDEVDRVGNMRSTQATVAGMRASVCSNPAYMKYLRYT